MKKLLSALLTALLIIVMLPVSAFASNLPTQKTIMPPLSKANLILDTSNPDIGVAFFIEDEQKFLTKYQTTKRTGDGYFYIKSSGDVIANFNCTGYFSYDGKICNITDIDTSVWATIDGWRVEVDESMNQISPTYTCATGVFDLYEVGIFGDSLSSSATINVYCNQNGSTNVEFNSD